MMETCTAFGSATSVTSTCPPLKGGHLRTTGSPPSRLLRLRALPKSRTPQSGPQLDDTQTDDTQMNAAGLRFIWIPCVQVPTSWSRRQVLCVQVLCLQVLRVAGFSAVSSATGAHLGRRPSRSNSRIPVQRRQWRLLRLPHLRGLSHRSGDI